MLPQELGQLKKTKVGFAMQVVKVNEVLMAVNQMVDIGNVAHQNKGSALDCALQNNIQNIDVCS